MSLSIHTLVPPILPLDSDRHLHIGFMLLECFLFELGDHHTVRKAKLAMWTLTTENSQGLQLRTDL